MTRRLHRRRPSGVRILRTASFAPRRSSCGEGDRWGSLRVGSRWSPGALAAWANVEAALDLLERELGPIDLLVNAHGIFPNTPVIEMDESEWDRVFDVNTKGTMLTCRALARRLVRRNAPGAIVNISSAAATSARAGGAHYTASKAAVNLLTHVLAIELGPHAIRVNAVAPGLVLDEVLREEAGHSSEYVRLMLRGTPLRRTGAPEDIAPAVAFLLSDRSRWTTGAILEVTGGSHCGRPHVPLSRDLR
ncbi:MAG: SDR family oxidoreductase [Chloroflexi bacterium]|nr:MAG: SDR family oxidoreductase [Chloroflexota bacterium]